MPDARVVVTPCGYETPASGSCVAGGAQTTDILPGSFWPGPYHVCDADGSWRLPLGPWFNVCDREPCGQRWTSEPNPTHCPSCLASMAWISSFTWKPDADDYVPLFRQERLVERVAA